MIGEAEMMLMNGKLEHPASGYPELKRGAI
jgi:hypothetical protein